MKVLMSAQRPQQVGMQYSAMKTIRHIKEQFTQRANSCALTKHSGLLGENLPIYLSGFDCTGFPSVYTEPQEERCGYKFVRDIRWVRISAEIVKDTAESVSQPPNKAIEEYRDNGYVSKTVKGEYERRGLDRFHAGDIPHYWTGESGCYVLASGYCAPSWKEDC